MWHAVPPRDPKNPRLAKVDNRNKNVGEGGIVYVLDEGHTLHKYKCVTEDEQKKEEENYVRLYSESQRKNVKTLRSRTPSPIPWRPTPSSPRRDIPDSPRPESARMTSPRQSPRQSPGQSPNQSPRKSAEGSPVTQMQPQLKRMSKSPAKEEPAIQMIPPKSMHIARPANQEDHGEKSPKKSGDSKAVASGKTSDNKADVHAGDKVPPPRPSSAGPQMRPASTGRMGVSKKANASDSALTTQSVDLGQSASASAAPDGLTSRSLTLHNRRRPRSAGRARASTPKQAWQISEHLQADQAKYVERRRAIEQREREKAQEEADELDKERERAKKAAELGTEFVEMKLRDEEQNRRKHARLDKKKKEEQEKEELARKKKREDWLKHLKKPIPKMEYTWKEMFAQAEEARKARIEERKFQLASSASHPFPDQYEAAVKKLQAQRQEEYRMNRINAPRASISFPIKAAAGAAGLEDDGEEYGVGSVAAALSAGKKSKVLKPSKQVEAMEKRHQQLEERKKEREERRRQKEAEEAALKVAVERRKIERMMNARLPESRPTRVVEKRNEWVRLQLEKKKEDKLREQSMMKQKQMKERELGAWLKTLIDMNEEERKSKYPGYIELSATQRLAAERAAEGKEVYKAAYKANQKRLHDAVQSRPSLIERHDNAIGALHASDAALEMLTGDEDDDEDEDDDDDDYDDDDDLFDEDEKLVLKAKQSVQE